MNFADPFGLSGCTIANWTGCEVLSGTVGWGIGLGVKTQLGPVEIKGELGKAGVEASGTLGLDGFHTDGEATAAAFDGSVRVGSHELGVTAGSCGTKSGCQAGSAGMKNVEGASNGDISVKAKAGVELGVTFHAGQTATAFVGVANSAWTAISAWVWKHVAGPYGSAGSSDSPH